MKRNGVASVKVMALVGVGVIVAGGAVWGLVGGSPEVDKNPLNLPDNLLWETDFPHPTCQHPGPANSWAQRPAEYAEKALADVSEATLQKVLHDNAAALYGIP